MNCKNAKNKNKKYPMQKKSKRRFLEIGEDEVVKVWYASKSKAEVLRSLKITNFGTKAKRLKELIVKYQLPPFHLKKINDLTSSEISQALKDVSINTLKKLCIKLNIAKKIHNAALKKRIIEEKLDVPEHIYKSIYGTKRAPWVYPRSYFIKRNNKIPTTCPQCGFIARVPKQIQIHHVKSDSKFNFGNEEKKEKLRGISLKGQKEYPVLPNLKTICANCHSLEHHTRGQIEKDSCGLWLRKKTTHQLYKNPREMFKLDCRHTHTLQKKYFLRTILKPSEDYVCNECNVSKWQNKQLVLQLHHKDGNRLNAQLNNLVLLCPNCHAATKSWGG